MDPSNLPKMDNKKHISLNVSSVDTLKTEYPEITNIKIITENKLKCMTYLTADVPKNIMKKLICDKNVNDYDYHNHSIHVVENKVNAEAMWN